MTTPTLPSDSRGQSLPIRFLSRLSIGNKLRMGFGILVLLTVAMIVLSVLGGNSATREINRTNTVRAPIALTAASAHASLLRMISDVRGYLALGDKSLRDDYLAAERDFTQYLEKLEGLSRDTNTPIEGLAELRQEYVQWQEITPRLFDLHDDQLQREPALNKLIKEGSPLIAEITKLTKQLIEARMKGEQDAKGIELIQALTSFQGSFTSMVSGLRGWVTTQRTAFYTEYVSNQIVNEEAWQKLNQARTSMTSEQQDLLIEIEKNRQQLIPLADDIISLAAGEHVREDLYLFREEALPPAERMLATLSTITSEQQNLLASDLAQGSADLLLARRQVLFAGVIIAMMAFGLAFLFGGMIVGPIRRLTRVAEQIGAGDLDLEARVESQDEIGQLATTFNGMTSQLRQTLNQVRTEKKRADDLLDVVIPIGAAFSSEKDFNRLLEKIVLAAKDFCGASAGALFLRTDDAALKYMIVRNDVRDAAFGGTSGNPIPFPPVPLYDPQTSVPNMRHPAAYAALTGKSVNIANSDAAPEFDVRVPLDFDGNVEPISLLLIPLKNSRGEVAGVLELLDARDRTTHTVIPFDANLQRLTESFSLLASAALEAYTREQNLRQEIRQLRIEIDEVKRKQQVEAIVETDFFQNLRTKALAMRQRNRNEGQQQPEKESAVSLAAKAQSDEQPSE